MCVPKAPASPLCRTELPPNLGRPVQHPLSRETNAAVSRGKLPVCKTFWLVVPVSKANSILTSKSARLQLAWFETRLPLVCQTDPLLFCPCPSLEEWPVSFLVVCPSPSWQPPVPFHLHSNRPYWWCNTYQLIIKLPTHSFCWKVTVIQWRNILCSLWHLAASHGERSRARRAKGASLPASAEISAFSIEFSFLQLTLGVAKKISCYANLSTSKCHLMQSPCLAGAVLI